MNTTPRKDLPIIIIGTGSVGVHFVHELLKRSPDIHIKIFGGEERQPYRREDLTKMLAGELSEDVIHQSTQLPLVDNVEIFLNNAIVSIDKDAGEVTDSLGIQHTYKKLVLAIGSTARKLEVEGTSLKNVFSFRNIFDVESLKSRQMASRNTVVIGGSQIGLDVSYAMSRHNTKVTIIEHSTRLMHRQLDDHASVYLRLYLDDLGIKVRKRRHVVCINGESKVESVTLNDGEIIPCDTVITTIGIRPNVQLAIDNKIHVNQGIVVDHKLQTNALNIHAIGECAEYGGRIYGLSKPGFEQAEVLATNIAGKSANYKGSTATTRLKVVDYPILSIGDNGEGAMSNKEVMYRDIKQMVYRKLVLNQGRLLGVIAAGHWKMDDELHEMVEKKQYIWPWEKRRFLRTGEL